jgi:hypothetical protein
MQEAPSGSLAAVVAGLGQLELALLEVLAAAAVRSRLFPQSASLPEQRST